MTFTDTLAKSITGKSKEQRLRDSAANKIIKEKADTAYLKAKELQAIKFAQKRAQIETEQKIKQYKNRLAYNNQSYTSPLGGGSSSYSIFSGGYSIPKTSAPMTRRTPKKIKRRGKVKTRIVYRNPPQPSFRPFGW